jgi:hypothetical protein
MENFNKEMLDQWLNTYNNIKDLLDRYLYSERNWTYFPGDICTFYIEDGCIFMEWNHFDEEKMRFCKMADSIEIHELENWILYNKNDDYQSPLT